MDPTIVAIKSAVGAGKSLANTIAKEGRNHVDDHYAELKQLKGISYSLVKSYKTLESAAEARNLQQQDVDQVVDAAATVEELVSSLRGPSLLQRIMFWKKSDARPEAIAFKNSLTKASAQLRTAEVLAAAYRKDRTDFAFNGDDDRIRRSDEVNEATDKAKAGLGKLNEDASSLNEFLNKYFINRV